VDCCRLAKLAGETETMVVVAARSAQLHIEKVDLANLTGIENPVMSNIRERLLTWDVAIEYKAKKGMMIYWERGFEYSNAEVRDGLKRISAILLESLAEQLGISIYELRSEHFRTNKGAPPPALKGLSMKLTGLHEYLFKKWQLSKAADHIDAIEYMFKYLELPTFGELPLREQLTILKAIGNDEKRRIPWSKLPVSTQKYLVRKMMKDHGLPVTLESFKKPLKGLGFSLEGLYFNYFHRPRRSEKSVIGFILGELNVKKTRDAA